ncbi:septum formation initiator family protein [bacterium]|nr:septum formation initiator family protein [bacterium]
MNLKTKHTPKLLLALFLTIITYFCFGGNANLYRLWRLTRMKQALQTEIDILHRGNDELRERIEKLQSDLTYIEKIARENYNMGYKGETIYRINSSVISE